MLVAGWVSSFLVNLLKLMRGGSLKVLLPEKYGRVMRTWAIKESKSELTKQTPQEDKWEPSWLQLKAAKGENPTWLVLSQEGAGMHQA